MRIRTGRFAQQRHHPLARLLRPNMDVEIVGIANERVSALLRTPPRIRFLFVGPQLRSPLPSRRPHGPTPCGSLRLL
jgi:hypothetical protein